MMNSSSIETNTNDYDDNSVDNEKSVEIENTDNNSENSETDNQNYTEEDSNESIDDYNENIENNDKYKLTNNYNENIEEKVNDNDSEKSEYLSDSEFSEISDKRQMKKGFSLNDLDKKSKHISIYESKFKNNSDNDINIRKGKKFNRNNETREDHSFIIDGDILLKTKKNGYRKNNEKLSSNSKNKIILPSFKELYCISKTASNIDCLVNKEENENFYSTNKLRKHKISSKNNIQNHEDDDYSQGETTDSQNNNSYYYSNNQTIKKSQQGSKKKNKKNNYGKNKLEDDDNDEKIDDTNRNTEYGDTSEYYENEEYNNSEFVDNSENVENDYNDNDDENNENNENDNTSNDEYSKYNNYDNYSNGDINNESVSSEQEDNIYNINKHYSYDTQINNIKKHSDNYSSDDYEDLPLSQTVQREKNIYYKDHLRHNNVKLRKINDYYIKDDNTSYLKNSEYQCDTSYNSENDESDNDDNDITENQNKSKISNETGKKLKKIIKEEVKKNFIIKKDINRFKNSTVNSPSKSVSYYNADSENDYVRSINKSLYSTDYNLGKINEKTESETENDEAIMLMNPYYYQSNSSYNASSSYY
ncbi:hypothetical protein PIROE2DRAFT_59687 [Piromyces sp. E2]|nr:hypothetical protein PIROE2DRAFT_59687 [Piromyces sp. E2]|eukprot:OUM65969.1 hypothetical protein PIROE2DRAFT_59687 [Piromyces sp. E2]